MENQVELAKKVFDANPVFPEGNYGELLEELKSIMTEGIWNSKVELIKTKWHIGQRIMAEFHETGTKEVKPLLTRLAKDLRTSESELYRCTEFFTKFLLEHKCKTADDVLELFPKNISWFKIRTEYLPELPMAKIPYVLPVIEMEDKFGLIKWWATNSNKQFELILTQMNNDEEVRLSVKLCPSKAEKVESTPLKEVFKEIGSYYIQLKNWNIKDLDKEDYARMNKSIKRLLMKAKGDKNRIKQAILYVSQQEYLEWTLETVEKKYADAHRLVKPYEKYLKKGR